MTSAGSVYLPLRRDYYGNQLIDEAAHPAVVGNALIVELRLGRAVPSGDRLAVHFGGPLVVETVTPRGSAWHRQPGVPQTV